MVYYLGRDVKVYLTTESTEAQVAVSSNTVTTEHTTVGGIVDVAATATVTITDLTELNDGDKVTLIATDTTSHDFTVGSVAGGGVWIAETDNDTSATNLAAAIDGNAKFSATVEDAEVTITQAIGGTPGNTTVTLTDTFTDGMTKTNFTGGENENYFDTSSVWNNSNKKYGLMVIIDTDGGATATANSNAARSYFSLNMMKTFPASNSHSQVIEIVDPMCVSLNSYPIAQSMSYNHKGKHQIVDDRLGKADIRKIGAAGGSLKLGGVDLSSETIRDKFHEFQKRATPVYCDSIHENGDVTRLFGVIVDMSQDHPTAKVLPKFSVSMQVSHMIMFDSTGAILTDGYISLGGEILNEPNYV